MPSFRGPQISYSPHTKVSLKISFSWTFGGRLVIGHCVCQAFCALQKVVFTGISNLPFVLEVPLILAVDYDGTLRICEPILIKREIRIGKWGYCIRHLEVLYQTSEYAIL